MNASHHRTARFGANILDQSRIARQGRARRDRIWLLGLLAVALFFAPAAVMAQATSAAPTPAAPSATPSPAANTSGVGKTVGGERLNLFEARAVPVDVTAASVAEARDKAFTDGRVAALHVVLERIAARGDLSRLPQLSSNDVIDMVGEFSVSNERTSTVRYLADLTVRFNPDAVRRLLRAAHIPFSETVSQPLVVLPLYSESAGAPPMLWEANNPWRDAFARIQGASGLVPLILPAGDAQDARLKIEQINARDATALADFAARYNAGGVVIAKASGGKPGGEAVQIVLTEMRGVAPPTDVVMSSAAPVGQSRDDMLTTAATAVADAVSEDWKRQSRQDVREAVAVTALASLTELKDWLQIKDRLRSVPLVTGIELQAMTRDRAQMTLRYSGDLATLPMMFAQQGLIATQQSGVWLLSLPRSAAQ